MLPFFLRRLQKHQIVVASIAGVLSGVYMWKAPLEQFQREHQVLEKGYDDIGTGTATREVSEADTQAELNTTS